MFEVQLAIYDLSHGMARQLSAQFLGGVQYAIDAIPHSGVVVYGQEYFYGSGIQSESPTLFRQMTGMVPFQIVSLGHTMVTQSEFEQWCSEQMSHHLGGRFTPQSYDLLECNCNHFAHSAVLEGLRLSQGVPDWVLQVPQRFLASPMGQIVRPMLDQMQLRAPVEGAHSIHSSNNNNNNSSLDATAAFPSVAANPWANMNESTSATTTSNKSAAAAAAGTNPWANHVDNDKNNGKGANPNQQTTIAATPSQAHPLLDTFVKPLVSKDVKTIPMCIQKIIKTATHLQQPENVVFLQHCQDTLVSSTAFLSSEEATRLCQLLFQCLERQQTVTFVLMLLRILVAEDRYAAHCQESLGWIQNHLIFGSKASSSSSPLSSVPSRTMAWLVLSNALASPLAKYWTATQEEEEEALIQAAIRSMTDAGEASSIR